MYLSCFIVIVKDLQNRILINHHNTAYRGVDRFSNPGGKQ